MTARMPPVLEKVPPELVGREVGVRALIPLVQAARDKGFDPERLAVGTGYPLSHFSNARERVSWAAFTRFMSNLGGLLSDDELVAVGRGALESPFFRAFLLPGRLLFDAADIYRWLFSPTGPAVQLFTASQSVIIDLAPGLLRFETWMKPGYAPSRENNLLLFGLLQGLSRSLGADEAQVTRVETAAAFTFDIRLSAEVGPRRFLKKQFGWLFAARSAGEALRRAHVELQDRYVELQREVLARNAVEVQLRQSQKMEAVGRLAGGIAHDFNNVLTVILSYQSLLAHDLRQGDPKWGELDEIRKAGEQAADLTRQLLAFSRQPVLQPKVVDLNRVVGDMDKLLRRLIGEDIELVARPAPGLGAVHVDPGQMQQVVMNLAVNARDAMPKGGTLTLETANVELDEQYAREHLGVLSGSYVMLAVSDTGMGMDKATQARIFDPFFTTKELGKGTGLGLSTVLGIVQQSRGSIWLYSEPGRGTTFKVYLPRIDEAPAEARTVPGARVATGTETVLVVEDQAQVLRVIAGILAQAGYRVLEARTGVEGLRVAEEHRGPIHLLLSDVVLPGLSGPQLAENLSARRPETKVLFMSGYTDNAIGQHGLLEPGVAFLQKPVTPGVLLEKVRTVLG